MNQKERLFIKVCILVSREKGMITRNDVFELADGMGYTGTISNKTADNMISRACAEYGY
jgi:hypothetical protein